MPSPLDSACSHGGHFVFAGRSEVVESAGGVNHLSRFQDIVVSMMVKLTPHGQELVEAALARGVGRSPEEVIERALRAITGATSTPSEEACERRRLAVAAMLASREEYHLTLGPGERVQDLIHEGHKY
jgi:hypothetical protein